MSQDLPSAAVLICALRVKILNTFLFLFSNKMLLFRAGIHKMFVKVANKEDPDQTASSSGSALFVQAFLAGN